MIPIVNCLISADMCIENWILNSLLTLDFYGIEFKWWRAQKKMLCKFIVGVKIICVFCCFWLGEVWIWILKYKFGQRNDLWFVITIGGNVNDTTNQYCYGYGRCELFDHFRFRRQSMNPLCLCFSNLFVLC